MEFSIGYALSVIIKHSNDLILETAMTPMESVEKSHLIDIKDDVGNIIEVCELIVSAINGELRMRKYKTKKQQKEGGEE